MLFIFIENEGKNERFQMEKSLKKINTTYLIFLKSILKSLVPQSLLHFFDYFMSIYRKLAVVPSAAWDF